MFIDEHEMEGTLQKLEGFTNSEHEQSNNEGHETIDLGTLRMKNLMDYVSSQ